MLEVYGSLYFRRLGFRVVGIVGFRGLALRALGLGF